LSYLRDPATRLGTRHDSPKDVMESPFFENLDWESILARTTDGPWVPDTGYVKRNTKARPADIMEALDERDDQLGEGKFTDNASVESEVIHIRDSIICPPAKKGAKGYSNQITDWSFMDETALTSAVASARIR
jgi:hypothetical protein